MARKPKEIELLDGEVFDTPYRLTSVEAQFEGNGGWRRRLDETNAEREDEQ